jgi:putative DNA-invertase from lambdoid prophage Rac
MAVYGYVRVSTAAQADSGESLGAQQRTLEGYAMMLNVKLDQVFVERGVSGSKPLLVRREGKRLVATLKPGDVVITAKLDRMFRSARDALDVLDRLKRQNVSLHMIDLGGNVTGNGISKLVFTILSAVAEAERDRIRERIAEVKADQRQRNRYLGGDKPFGFDVKDGELVPIAHEQAAIRRMVKLRAKGESLRAIAAEMKRAGFDLSHYGVDKIIKAARKRRAAEETTAFTFGAPSATNHK